MNFLRSASFLVALLILCGCYEAHGDDDPRLLPGDAGPLARVDAARGPGPGA